MNSVSIPVVHPGFQNLKRSSRLMHLFAGGLILAHAISHLSEPDFSIVYSGCLLLIALDIFILVFAGRHILVDFPKVNLFFRLTEVLFFVGIGANMLFESRWIMGIVHLVLSIAFIYLFYCEKQAQTKEYIAIHHTGVSIPSLPDSKFYNWSTIARIDAHYDSITIDTSLNKSFRFEIRKNLAFEELDQIHEFCKHYLQQY
jgi:hypothetical protein